MTEKHKFTPQQIVQIIATPHGADSFIEDERVIAERKKISAKYSELKGIPIWFPGRGPEGQHNGEGAMLLPGFEYAAIEARAWWLSENVEGL